MSSRGEIFWFAILRRCMWLPWADDSRVRIENALTWMKRKVSRRILNCIFCCFESWFVSWWFWPRLFAFYTNRICRNKQLLKGGREQISDCDLGLRAPQANTGKNWTYRTYNFQLPSKKLPRSFSTTDLLGIQSIVWLYRWIVMSKAGYLSLNSLTCKACKTTTEKSFKD